MEHTLPVPTNHPSSSYSGPSGNGTSEGRSAADAELTVTQLLKRSAKYWRSSLATLSAAIAIGLGYGMLAHRLYQSATTVKISTYGSLGVQSLLDSRFIQDSLQRSYAKTQVKLLKSSRIADAVLADPNIGPSVTAYLQKTRPTLDTVQSPAPKDASQYRASPQLLHSYLDLISIQDVKETTLVQVSALTTDPQLSHDIANAHARHFIELVKEERKQAVSEAVSFLQTQATGLYQKMKQSEDAIAHYAEQHSLLTLSDEEALFLKSANQVSDTHAKAVTARVQLETILQDVKDRPLDDVTLLDDSSIRSLRTSLKQAEADYADLRTKFSSDYPDVIQLRARITALTELIRQQRSQALASLQIKYQSAVAIENSLEQDLQAKRTEDRKLSGELVRYNQLKREYQSLVDLHQSVLRQLKVTQLSTSSKTATASIREFATIATSPAYPRIPGILLLATGVGLFLGVISGLCRQALDTSLCSQQLRMNEQGIKVLGIIPSSSSVAKRNLRGFLRNATSAESSPQRSQLPVTQADPLSQSSDAFRALRASVLASSEATLPRSILVTSAEQGEGKSYVSENLAISMAQSDRRTILIDADLRKTASSTSVRPHAKSLGLSDFLLGNAPLDSVILKSEVSNLWIMPPGTALDSPSELIDPAQTKQLLSELSKSYECIIIDSPPTRLFSDAISLGSCADAVLVVTREGTSQTPAVNETILRLSAARANILGFVINSLTPLYAAA